MQGWATMMGGEIPLGVKRIREGVEQFDGASGGSFGLRRAAPAKGGCERRSGWRLVRDAVGLVHNGQGTSDLREAARLVQESR
jgi:hypothetical protein